ncbi:hypothetical protein ABGB17_19340 [Sphaerisporangium sp. B11E5]|uniref:hypothetical protein n=1 Tax=Sphaerisporangium sp. B11E5 TaxID=3153563 RepID=UPI00325DDDCD
MRRDLHGGESLDLATDGRTLVAYGAQPATDSDGKLRLLASWAGTLDHATAPHTPTAAPPPTTAGSTTAPPPSTSAV